MVYFVMALALFADDDYAPYFLLDQVRAPRAEHPAWTAQVCLELGVAGFVFPALVVATRGSPTRTDRAWSSSSAPPRRAAASSASRFQRRMKENARLPVLEMLPDGSYRSVLIAPPFVARSPPLGSL